MRKLILALVTLSLLAGGIPALASEAAPFITSKEINLVRLLAPPPANDSGQMKAELNEILSLQAARTPEMAARAQADTTEDIWRFAEVAGAGLQRERLPVFAGFFQRVVATEAAVIDPYKDTWKRTRPFMYSDLVKPAVRLSRSGSYPSGHATVGTLMGLILANMIPEKRAEIMARAAEYANNRVIGGAHYRSDVEAGRLTATAIAARLEAQEEFLSAFEAAKNELRAVMQLSPIPAGETIR